MIPRFRAWWVEREVMCDVDVIGFSEGAITVSNENTTYEHLGLNEVELMQSTGLKDKNGVEIYEGDIMNLKYPRDRRYKVVAKVINGQEVSAKVLKFDNDFTTEEFPLYKISAENNLEVIGNIWEDGELLEVAE